MSERGRFGDGTPMPDSTVRPFEAGTPTLEAVYPLALAAQRAGQSYVYVAADAAGRPWAMALDAFGVRGMVVRRYRAEQNADEVKATLENGRSVDAAPIAKLLVRFAVLDVLLAHKRAYLRDLNPDSSRLVMNRPRRPVPRSVTIR
jgi:hypothetical protein